MSRSDPSNRKLVGGRLCLDFVNTVDCRNSDQQRDSLVSYENLILWSQHAEILTENETDSLRAEASAHPAEARRVLERAIAARESLYGIFSAVIHHKHPSARDLETLNREMSLAMAHIHLKPAVDTDPWIRIFEDAKLEKVLWSVFDSAKELLTSDKLDRLSECRGENCGWLFLDLSRNRSRKWCDMKDCGNIAKARRHYKKTKQDRKC